MMLSRGSSTTSRFGFRNSTDVPHGGTTRYYTARPLHMREGDMLNAPFSHEITFYENVLI